MSKEADEITGHKLAQLWGSAMIFAPHLAGCSCAGGFSVSLDPSAIEEDLLDFLSYRYRGEGRKTLADFVSARSADRSTDFARWLETLATAPIDNADRDRLMNDIFTTLDSMNGARSARTGFVCY